MCTRQRVSPSAPRQNALLPVPLQWVSLLEEENLHLVTGTLHRRLLPEVGMDSSWLVWWHNLSLMLLPYPFISPTY